MSKKKKILSTLLLTAGAIIIALSFGYYYKYSISPRNEIKEVYKEFRLPESIKLSEQYWLGGVQVFNLKSDFIDHKPNTLISIYEVNNQLRTALYDETLTILKNQGWNIIDLYENSEDKNEQDLISAIDGTGNLRIDITLVKCAENGGRIEGDCSGLEISDTVSEVYVEIKNRYVL